MEEIESQVLKPYRSKTSLRLKYEAETAVLKHELGSLEDIRIKLGLTRRKICQILMVDPSAWTRWSGENGDAPPHIYQALRWYMDSKGLQNQRFDASWNVLKAENEAIRGQIAGLQRSFRGLMIGFLCVTLALVVFFVAQK